MIAPARTILLSLVGTTPLSSLTADSDMLETCEEQGKEGTKKQQYATRMSSSSSCVTDFIPASRTSHGLLVSFNVVPVRSYIYLHLYHRGIFVT